MSAVPNITSRWQAVECINKALDRLAALALGGGS